MLNTPNSSTQLDPRQWTVIVITQKKKKKKGKVFFIWEQRKEERPDYRLVRISCMSVTHHRKVQPGPTLTRQADKQGKVRRGWISLKFCKDLFLNFKSRRFKVYIRRASMKNGFLIQRRL